MALEEPKRGLEIHAAEQDGLTSGARRRLGVTVARSCVTNGFGASGPIHHTGFALPAEPNPKILSGWSNRVDFHHSLSDSLRTQKTELIR